MEYVFSITFFILFLCNTRRVDLATQYTRMSTFGIILCIVALEILGIIISIKQQQIYCKCREIVYNYYGRKLFRCNSEIRCKYIL